MLRIVLQTVHTGDAANIGGPVLTKVVTFDVDLPTVESFLLSEDKWNSVQVMGIEVLQAQAAGGGWDE